MQGGVADVPPGPRQVLIVALDFRLGALGPGGADDQAHSRRHVQVGDDPAQAFAVGHGGDLAADPATPIGVGHQHAITAGQGQIGGQRRALGSALLLDHLDQHDLAPLDHLLDLVAAHQPLAAAGDFLVDLVVVVPAAEVLGRRGLRLVVDGAGRGMIVVLLLGFPQQGFAVGVGDLIVVGVDFVERQEAVAIAAIFDERRLQAGLYPGDLGQIDVAAQLPAGAAFEIEFLNLVSVQDDDPRFLGVGGVDQHLLGHRSGLRGARRARGPGAG